MGPVVITPALETTTAGPPERSFRPVEQASHIGCRRHIGLDRKRRPAGTLDLAHHQSGLLGRSGIVDDDPPAPARQV